MSLVRGLSFKTNANITLRADCKMLKEVSKSAQMSAQDLWKALAISARVKVRESTVGKRLHKFNFHGKHARRKPFLSIKSNIKAGLILALEKIKFGISFLFQR